MGILVSKFLCVCVWETGEFSCKELFHSTKSGTAEKLNKSFLLPIGKCPAQRCEKKDIKRKSVMGGVHGNSRGAELSCSEPMKQIYSKERHHAAWHTQLRHNSVIGTEGHCFGERLCENLSILSDTTGEKRSPVTSEDFTEQCHTHTCTFNCSAFIAVHEFATNSILELFLLIYDKQNCMV